MVKVSATTVEDTWIDSRLPRSSCTYDLEIGALAANLQGDWCSRVSAGTGWPRVRMLCLGEMASLVGNFYLSIAARAVVSADPSLRQSLSVAGDLSI